MSLKHTTHLRRWLLSLPPIEYLVQQLRETLIGALKCGPIPEHIAFVMDGNRRYARKNQVETVEGHHLGFEALARILEVCYKSGVRVVTIYAFSIENFKRSRYEVDGLMDMAKTKLVQMAQHGELLDRYGASVRILGDRSLIRHDVLEHVDRAVDMTKHNHDAVLNVCFPYTGREEITHSIREAVREFSSPPPMKSPTKRPFSETHIQRTLLTRHLLPPVEEEEGDRQQQRSPLLAASSAAPPSSDADSTTSASERDDLDATISAQPSSRTSHSASPVLHGTRVLPDPETMTTATITKHTYFPDAPPLDLLVRTSGVQRLSDFMLWQCHETTDIRFLDCLWPEFDLWQFLPVLVEWQWRQKQKRQQTTATAAKDR